MGVSLKPNKEQLQASPLSPFPFPLSPALSPHSPLPTPHSPLPIPHSSLRKIHPTQESPEAIALGMGQHLSRCAFFFDTALVEKNDTVGDFSGELHFVGDDHHGHAFFGELLHDAEDFADQFGVEGAGGFVKEHDFGFHAEGTGDRYPLLLAAGKLVGIGSGFLQKADFVEEEPGDFSAFSRGLFEDFLGGEGEVVEDGHVGEEVELLEHHAHLGAELSQLLSREVGLGEVDAVDPELAAVDGFETVETPQ